MTGSNSDPPGSLFDFRFLELDVLARDGIVFAEGHLLGDVPRILLGHVEEAGVGGADELDLDRGRLGHDSLSQFEMAKKESGETAALFRAASAPRSPFCQDRHPRASQHFMV